jgi:hypothetical protein
MVLLYSIMLIVVFLLVSDDVLWKELKIYFLDMFHIQPSMDGAWVFDM